MRHAPLAVLLTAAGFAACAPTEPADLVLTGGKIAIVDEAFTIHSTLVVRDGRVLAVGGPEIASRYDAARTIDLAGRLVVPGFNDTHTHIRGNARRYIDLTGVNSIVEIQDLVRAKIIEMGEGEWITGYGWSEDELAEGRRPLRADLDAAAPRNPVMLTRAGGHSGVANSVALTLAGVDRTTPQPEGGVIEYDARGELNGVIRERQGIVGRLAPDATPAELRETQIQVLRNQLALGITSLIQAGETPEDFGRWESIYEELGTELPRATVQIRWVGTDQLAAFGRRTGDGTDRLRVGAIKVLVDGGFTGPAAYTTEPYPGMGDYRGLLNVPEPELRQLIDEAHELGWQLGFHAIGDAAIELTVDAFVDALTKNPRVDHRHYLNHFTVTPSVRTMELMAEHGIAIAQQPNFTYTLEGRYAANLEGDRLAHNNPLKIPMQYGIFMALSSDILPIDPRVGLYAAVTRKGMSGQVYATDEALTMEEAIRGYTANAAWLTFEEDTKGTLEPGMLADMVVLAEDLLTIDPERIMDVAVDMTIVGGRVLFERR
ncbi:MAG: amidohydrolase [Gemmatimonadetes bacterium]|nr:amidohydrolase [Gemmatimonadota bacterium]MDA1103251.1 amidohydrolase [Gemmatimonadota bacterium]